MEFHLTVEGAQTPLVLLDDVPKRLILKLKIGMGNLTVSTCACVKWEDISNVVLVQCSDY